jgi:hypothetical protein
MAQTSVHGLIVALILAMGTGAVAQEVGSRVPESAGAAAAEAVVHHPAADHAQHARLHHHADRSRRREAVGHELRATVPANVSPALRSLYREYKEQGGGPRFAPGPLGGRPLQVSGTRVAVLIKAAFPPALGAYLRDLGADGLQIISTSPAYGLADRVLPIAKLPAAAQVAAHVWPAPPPSMRLLHRDTHRWIWAAFTS